MKTSLKTIALLLLSLLTLTIACQEDRSHEAHGPEQIYTCPMHPQIVQTSPGTCPICGMDLVPVSKGGENQGELMLSESQIQLANIRTMAVGLNASSSNTILTGKLVLDETQNELISSRAAGRIERLYIKETGQQVRKGQPLYELYSEELLSLQREYLLALEQYRALGDQEPRYASFLEAARKKLLLYGLTEAQIKQLASSGKLEPKVTFLAPASGVVTDIAATEGQYVAEGGILYRLGDLSKIWVEAELYPQEVQKINSGDQVLVNVQGFAQTVPARVTFISPELRQGSQVITLRAELPNPQGQFLPGMQANVVLPQQQSQIIRVPNDAVLRDQKGSHVWVQTGEGTFKARRVTVGEANFDSVALLAGVREQEQVVTSGAYLLYSEYVLKKGGDPIGNPLTAPLEARPVDLEQTPTEAFILGDVKDFGAQAPEAFKKDLIPLMQAYLSLKDALVAGNTTASAQAAKTLMEALLKVNDSGLSSEAANFWKEKKAFLMQHAKESLAANTLEAKRENFIYLSQPMIKVAEAFNSPEGLFIQYCPMANHDAGAHWLSAEPEIRNPYYGDAMLSCGEVVKKL